MSARVANPWYKPGQGTVGPFYTVPDRPAKVHANGWKSYRLPASVLTVDEEGRAVMETVGIPAEPWTSPYRYVYPKDGPPTFAFHFEKDAEAAKLEGA